MPILIPRALQGLYFLCEPIADGSFGRLYLAIHALTRQQVAIKIIDKKKLGVSVFLFLILLLQNEVFRVRSEVEALKRLSHPNIYSLYQVIETDGTFYLVLEVLAFSYNFLLQYVPGGELFDYILHNGSLEESHARILFRQLVSAIGYSHSKGIAHRDLKPVFKTISLLYFTYQENILLKDDETIRVIDFGLCAKVGWFIYKLSFSRMLITKPLILTADLWHMRLLKFSPTKNTMVLL